MTELPLTLSIVGDVKHRVDLHFNDSFLHQTWLIISVYPETLYKGSRDLGYGGSTKQRVKLIPHSKQDDTAELAKKNLAPLTSDNVHIHIVVDDITNPKSAYMPPYSELAFLLYALHQEDNFYVEASTETARTMDAKSTTLPFGLGRRNWTVDRFLYTAEEGTWLATLTRQLNVAAFAFRIGLTHIHWGIRHNGSSPRQPFLSAFKTEATFLSSLRQYLLPANVISLEFGVNNPMATDFTKMFAAHTIYGDSSSDFPAYRAVLQQYRGQQNGVQYDATALSEFRKKYELRGGFFAATTPDGRSTRQAKLQELEEAKAALDRGKAEELEREKMD